MEARKRVLHILTYVEDRYYDVDPSKSTFLPRRSMAVRKRAFHTYIEDRLRYTVDPSISTFFPQKVYGGKETNSTHIH